jgi:hypothetical protein
VVFKKNALLFFPTGGDGRSFQVVVEMDSPFPLRCVSPGGVEKRNRLPLGFVYAVQA